MPGVVAELELRLNMQKAEADAANAGQRIGKAVFAGMTAEEARLHADNVVEGLKKQFTQRQADIKESLARSLITPAEAKKQGEDAARAFNAGVLSQIQGLGEAGALSGAGGQDAYVGLASKLKTVTSETTKLDAAMSATEKSGISRMRAGLLVLAQQATGTSSAVGQLSSGLLQFASGSEVVIAITATIALIAKTIDLITTSSRTAKVAVDELIDSLRTSVDAENKSIAAQVATATLRLHTLEAQGGPQPSFADRLKGYGADILTLNKIGSTAQLRYDQEVGNLRAVIEQGNAALQVQFDDSEHRRQKIVTEAADRAERALQEALKAAADAEAAVAKELARLGEESYKRNAPVGEGLRKQSRDAYDLQQQIAAVQTAMNTPLHIQAETDAQIHEAWLKTREESERHAAAVERAGRGALQLAAGLGVVNEATSQALQGAIALGANLKNALPTKDDLGKTHYDVSSILAVAGGVAQLASAWVGLFGNSPQEQARQKALEDNTGALRHLAANVTAITLTGTQQGQASQALAALSRTAGGRQALAAFPDRFASRFDSHDYTRELADAAHAVGVSFQDLVDIAKQLHITLDGTGGSIKQFAEALRLADQSKALQTYAGQRDRVQSDFQILGITDADQQLLETVGVIAEYSPVLRAALAGIDLSTAAGRAQARQALQAVYARANTPKGIPLTQLGDLNRADTIQAIQDLINGLNAADAGNPSAPSQSLSYRSSITETTALRLDSLLGTSNAYLRSIDANIARLAGGPAVGAAAPAGFSGPVSLTVNVDGVASPAAVADAVVTAIDQKLGGVLKRKAAMQGNVVMS